MRGEELARRQQTVAQIQGLAEDADGWEGQTGSLEGFVSHIWLAANLAQLGRLDEARAEAAEVLRLDPKYTIDGTQRRLALNKRPEDTEHLLDGLRKAGLPER